MGNILDYLQWRGDLSFAQSPFNEVDNLILSCFSYVNLDEITAVQDENGLTLEALSEEFFKIHTEEELKADKSFIRHAPFMMRDMAQTRRFGRSVIRNYVNEIVAEEEQQFSAVEILLEDGSTYAAFRGTDDTIVGWKEDFNLSNGIIPAEERAAEYLERIGRASSRMLRVGGHSKGGNLAVYAAAKCSEAVRGRIMEIYSNDGPGFTKRFLEEGSTREICSRLVRIIPEFSVIGMLEHEKEPVIVASSQKGILQHDGFSWEVLGTSFLREKGMNKKAASFNEIFHKWIDDMEDSKRVELIDELFAVIEAAGVENVSEIQEGGLKSLQAMFRRFEKSSADFRIMLQELIGALFSGWLERLHAETQDKIPFLSQEK